MQNIFSQQALEHSFDLSWQLLCQNSHRCFSPLNCSSWLDLSLHRHTCFDPKVSFQWIYKILWELYINVFYWCLLLQKASCQESTCISNFSSCISEIKHACFLKKLMRTDSKNYFFSFQRTPSLRRKWRKRYGGLDSNKLLEPNKEDDKRGSQTKHCKSVI